MNLSELVRLATTPGPMQQLAQDALMEEFAADERAQGMRGRNEQFDIARFAPQYIEEYVDRPRPPMGDLSPEEQEGALTEEALARLAEMYDRQYPESALDKAGGYAKGIGDYLTSQEGVRDTGSMLADTFLPAYSQLDSYNWAKENMDKYLDLRERDPLTATGYLPLVAAGYIGSVPGLSSLVSGGRKLGLAGKTAYEGLF